MHFDHSEWLTNLILAVLKHVLGSLCILFRLPFQHSTHTLHRGVVTFAEPLKVKRARANQPGQQHWTLTVSLSCIWLILIRYFLLPNFVLTWNTSSSLTSRPAGSFLSTRVSFFPQASDCSVRFSSTASIPVCVAISAKGMLSVSLNSSSTTAWLQQHGTPLICKMTVRKLP